MQSAHAKGMKNKFKSTDKLKFPIYFYFMFICVDIQNTRFFNDQFLLSDEQKNSLSFIRKIGNKYNVTVIEGVTGSGKTLVYFNRVKDFLDKGKIILSCYFMDKEYLTKEINQNDTALPSILNQNDSFRIDARSSAFVNYLKKNK